MPPPIFPSSQRPGGQGTGPPQDSLGSAVQGGWGGGWRDRKEGHWGKLRPQAKPNRARGPCPSQCPLLPRSLGPAAPLTPVLFFRAAGQGRWPQIPPLPADHLGLHCRLRSREAVRSSGSLLLLPAPLVGQRPFLPLVCASVGGGQCGWRNTVAAGSGRQSPQGPSASRWGPSTGARGPGTTSLTCRWRSPGKGRLPSCPHPAV